MTRFACRLLVVPALLLGAADGADFVVTTTIFVGDAATPAATHRVLFGQGRAYQQTVNDDRFSSVYDWQAGLVSLLDHQREVQTNVRLEDLLKVTAEAKASITDANDRSKMGIDAQVETVPQGYRVAFHEIEYQTRTEQPPAEGIAADYGRFADLALRMNIVRPVGPPPFARLAMNSQIAAQGEVPRELTLTIGRGDTPSRFRSDNQFGELNSDDRATIERIDSALGRFRTVTLKQFPQPGE